ncbi:MAG: hypothetical protein KGI73_01170 [Patescibacteria group bacterium]|nr:hypothetical protein [Patescibacteria group bacterium]
MNGALLWFVLIVIVVAAGVYWFAGTKRAEPSITITAPAGGEAWQPGETHAITWSMRDIPASDKISVTIRRLPPPPLPAEGQEFDPIIFTNLPNTGSTTWQISPMYPNGTYVIGLSAYESVPVTNPVSTESKPFTLMHPSLAADLSPLYANADWNAPKAESFLIGTTTYSGASATSAIISADMNPGAIFTPFTNYYDKKLKAAGFAVANDLAAGGHVGGQDGYRKDGRIIVIGFHIVYHTTPENAPSECPCDVTLSVFSGQ